MTDSQVRPEVRLSRVVPTLERMARRAQRAFTLVELMMAVALSTMLILMAAKCFQMVTKTVASANQMSVENSLMRTGLQLAWSDADYWKSYADPNPPFNKGWTRLAASPDSNGLSQGQWQRYFQPVLMLPRTDTSEQDPTGSVANLSCYNSPTPMAGENINFDNMKSQNNYYNDIYDPTQNFFKDPYNHADYCPNPNAMQAFDPRSICRVSVRPLFVPHMEDPNGNGAEYVIPGYFFGYPRLAIGDYSLVSATDMRDPPNCLNPKYITNPNGQNYVAGPAAGNSVTINRDTLYQTVQNDSVVLNIPVDNGMAMYQPLLYTQLYRKLSYVSMEYFNSGTPFYWTDDEGMTPDSITLPVPSYDAAIDDQGAFALYRWDRDWDAKLGQEDLVTRFGALLLPNEVSGGWGSRAPECIAFQPTWPQVGNTSAGYALIIPNNYEAAIAEYPFTILVGDSTEDGQVINGWGEATLMERGDVSRNDEHSITRTTWLPYNTTDAEKAEPDAGHSWAPTNSYTKMQVGTLDLVSKPAQSPVLTTSMVRYGKVMGGSDILIIRVSVDDPQLGRRIELSCTPTTTTFRGARQHWRLYSPQYTMTGTAPAGSRFGPAAYPCAGDYYDMTAGPYYVP